MFWPKGRRVLDRDATARRRQMDSGLGHILVDIHMTATVGCKCVRLRRPSPFSRADGHDISWGILLNAAMAWSHTEVGRPRGIRTLGK